MKKIISLITIIAFLSTNLAFGCEVGGVSGQAQESHLRIEQPAKAKGAGDDMAGEMQGKAAAGAEPAEARAEGALRLLQDIEEGSLIPSVWIGGRGSAVYRAINPKAEIVLTEKDFVEAGVFVQKLEELQGKFGLKDEDVVLFYFDRYVKSEEIFRIALVAMPFRDRMDIFKFAGVLTALSTKSSIYSQIIDICPAERTIDFVGLDIVPSKRKNGVIVMALSRAQRAILTTHFSDYEVTAKATHIYPVLDFIRHYDGGINRMYSSVDVVILPDGLDALRQLGLITENQEEALLPTRDKPDPVLPEICDILRAN